MLAPVIELLRKPRSLTILSGLCFVCAFISLTLTYGPIVKVELQYQYHRTLTQVFGVTSLRGLILPQFNFDRLYADNTQFGMQIPKLFLDEPIVFNVNPNDKKEYSVALKKGIAHAAGTELPEYPGLGYYFAHSSEPDLVNQYNAVFYLLGKLEKGDEIFLWHDNKKYQYTVFEKEVVDASDLSFLEPTYDHSVIVLQTCWPPGTTQRRLLVFAERK